MSCRVRRFLIELAVIVTSSLCLIAMGGRFYDALVSGWFLPAILLDVIKNDLPRSLNEFQWHFIFPVFTILILWLGSKYRGAAIAVTLWFLLNIYCTISFLLRYYGHS